MNVLVAIQDTRVLAVESFHNLNRSHLRFIPFCQNLSLDSSRLRRGHDVLVHGDGVNLPEATHEALALLVAAGLRLGVEDLHHAGVERRHHQHLLPPGQEGGVRGQAEAETNIHDSVCYLLSADIFTCAAA